MKRYLYIKFIVVLFFATQPALTATINVPGNYSTIQQAIDNSSSGDTVIVQPGTYYENIDFKGKNITLRSTDPENPAIVASTIINANGQGSVVTFKTSETNNAVLTGFTITGGIGTLTSSSSTSSYYYGGGIYCTNASPIISCNVITNNNCPVNNTSSPYFYGYGGGIYFANSNSIITRNIIKSNYAYNGGGVYTYNYNNSGTIIANNLIYLNTALFGGGVYFYYGANLINNTISDNSSTISSSTGQGGNLYAECYSNTVTPAVSQNIICNAKSGYGIYMYESGGIISFTYNNVWGNTTANYYSGTTDRTGMNGNISSNPLLTTDYHIVTNSPCKDKGDPNYIPYTWQLDIDGEYLPLGTRIDIGADEFTDYPKPVADAGDDQIFRNMPLSVTLDGSASYNPTGGGIVYQWQQTGGTNVLLLNANTVTPNFVPSANDVYTFKLVVYNGHYYSTPDYVMIVVGNRKPIAEAGANQACRPGQTVTLDGSGSYDLDQGDTITSYSWTQVSGTNVVLIEANTKKPHFTSPGWGNYVFELVVSDGQAQSLPDRVTVCCTPASAPDAYGYQWIDSDTSLGPQYHWIEFPFIGCTDIGNISNGTNRCYGPFPLGFSFNFYGNQYVSFYVQSNGLISFSSTPVTTPNKQIPAVDSFNNLIAWLWTSMYPSSNSKVYYKNYSDYTVVWFNNYQTNNGIIINAQVILYQSGKILVQYKDFTNTYYNYSYTVGIENANGTVGSQVAYNKNNYIHGQMAIEFSKGEGPFEPVAKAGPDRYIDMIELVNLDGSGSYSRNIKDANVVLSYQWTQISGTSVTFNNPNAASPTFMPAAEGEYWFQLVVSDGLLTSYPDQVMIYVGNRTPVAEAGTNQTCKKGDRITLNGSSSSDLDKTDVLTYNWTQISGPNVSLSNAHAISPQFTASSWGTYVFKLIVNDGLEDSLPDTVTIYCTPGSLQDAYGYSWISSDSQWGPKYKWIDIQQEGTIVNIGTTTSAGKYIGPYPLGFDFNFYGNIYNMFCIQSNGLISFSMKEVPSGYASIPSADGYNNIIAWMWMYMAPSASSKIYYKQFDGYTVIQFVNYASSSYGSMNAEVILYKSGKIVLQYKDSTSTYHYCSIGIENADGTIGTQVVYGYDRNVIHNELAIEFSKGWPYEPVAIAGQDQYLDEIDTVMLDGSDSYIRDVNNINSIPSYHWTQISGPNVVIEDATEAIACLTPPIEGEYWFRLTITDSMMMSSFDDVMVIVGNRPPVAEAGQSKFVQAQRIVTLDGTDSYDFDLYDELTYSWIKLSGPSVVLQNADTATPSFYCGTEGKYVFQLIVSDGFAESEPDTVEVTTTTVTKSQPNITAGFSSTLYFHYPDVFGDKVVYSVGSGGDFTWDIYWMNIKTGLFSSFSAGGLETRPKINGDIVVWFGGISSSNPWYQEPENTSVIARNIATGTQTILRNYTMSDSYGYPAVSGNKVVWLEHHNLDTTPLGSKEAKKWWNTSYSICGADINDLSNPVYFTVAENVGTRDPYACLSYNEDYDDVIDICGNIVVYEANGNIYGADVSNLNAIRCFTICDNSAQQLDPAIYGNIVVWTDRRNDAGDIYGADISDINNIHEFGIVKDAGDQEQPAINGRTIVYVDGSSGGGTIKACILTMQNAILNIDLSGAPYGIKPAIDGKYIVWQTAPTSGQVKGTSLEFGYTVSDGPVENVTFRKHYETIQSAISSSRDGDVIVVDAGVYYESINFNGKKITLRSTNPADPAIVASTVICGINNNTVNFIDGEAATSILTGLTIAGGYNGIYCYNSSPTISYCNIVESINSGISLYRACGPQISCCNITDNRSSGIELIAYYMGAIPVNNSPKINNCVISSNGYYGITGNIPTVTNCTISGNMIGGVYNSRATITNSIVYYNGDSTSSTQMPGSSSSTVTYSDIQGGFSGSGNIDVAPMFADPNNDDYHLKSKAGRWDPVSKTWVNDTENSPCIDTGNPASNIGDETVPNGSRINMGAYGGTNQASKSDL
jgi:beta propeller repeat protein